MATTNHRTEATNELDLSQHHADNSDEVRATTHAIRAQVHATMRLGDLLEALVETLRARPR